VLGRSLFYNFLKILDYQDLPVILVLPQAVDRAPELLYVNSNYECGPSERQR
jgi:hypothetical protein